MRIADAGHSRRRHITAYSRKSGSGRSRNRMPPLACGFAPMRRAPWARGREFRLQAALIVEKLLRPIAPHPVFEQRDVRGRVGRTAIGT